MGPLDSEMWHGMFHDADRTSGPLTLQQEIEDKLNVLLCKYLFSSLCFIDMFLFVCFSENGIGLFVCCCFHRREWLSDSKRDKLSPNLDIPLSFYYFVCFLKRPGFEWSKNAVFGPNVVFWFLSIFNGGGFFSDFLYPTLSVCLWRFFVPSVVCD